jgi:hypothetical protein
VSDGVKVDVSGETEIAAAVQRALDQLPGAVQVALLVEGSAIAADAASRCPVDTGKLRSSVFVKPISNGGVVVGFSAPHAAVVHERTDLRHADGEAKFLEKAKNSAASGLVSSVAARVKVG